VDSDGLGLRCLDNFHRGHRPNLQVVPTTKNAGIPSAAVRVPSVISSEMVTWQLNSQFPKKKVKRKHSSG